MLKLSLGRAEGLKLDTFFREAFLKRLEKLGFEEEEAKFMVLGSGFARLTSPEYALMKGKEFLEHCEIRGGCGQAFTDEPQECVLKLEEVGLLNLDKPANRALFFSALNALMSLQGEIEGAVHCVKAEADRCGELMAEEILRNYGNVKVVHVGYQPGHIKALTRRLSRVYVTDMNPENIGKERFGVKIFDASHNERLIQEADLALITGSSLINGTLFQLLEYCEKHGTPYLIYGVSAIGAAKLAGLKVFCPFTHKTLRETF
ncbi:MAG: hypothetical protein DRO46_02240 [Candidatus Hecatellales archaeon]|nr:MAG: hypothetical protein DRO46_02240 [Candidatus Hecatellales archaeon]